MIDPSNFGEDWWAVIHQMAGTAVTPEKRKAFKTYATKVLTVTIPCDNCLGHYKYLLTLYVIDEYMSSRDRLFLWTYLIHDAVNKRLGKRGISLEDARNQWIPGLEDNTVCTTVCTGASNESNAIKNGIVKQSKSNFKYRV